MRPPVGQEVGFSRRSETIALVFASPKNQRNSTLPLGQGDRPFEIGLRSRTTRGIRGTGQGPQSVKLGKPDDITGRFCLGDAIVENRKGLLGRIRQQEEFRPEAMVHRHVFSRTNGPLCRETLLEFAQALGGEALERGGPSSENAALCPYLGQIVHIRDLSQSTGQRGCLSAVAAITAKENGDVESMAKAAEMIDALGPFQCLTNALLRALRVTREPQKLSLLA